MDIELWFGGGDGVLVGPLEATCLEELPHNEVRALITDKGFLDHVGMDEPWEYRTERIGPDMRVPYDDFRWCPKGTGPAGQSHVWKP